MPLSNKALLLLLVVLFAVLFSCHTAAAKEASHEKESLNKYSVGELFDRCVARLLYLLDKTLCVTLMYFDSVGKKACEGCFKESPPDFEAMPQEAFSLSASKILEAVIRLPQEIVVLARAATKTSDATKPEDTTKSDDKTKPDDKTKRNHPKPEERTNRKQYSIVV